MRNVVPANWAHLGSLQCRDGSRMAIKSDEFHFVSSAILVNVDNSANVSGFKTFTWQRCCQYDSFVFFNHRGIPRRDMQ